MIRRTVSVLLALGLLQACTNVASMQKKYEAGDESQYTRIMQVASRPDYPYATRKRAVRALAEIGDPRALPVFIGALSDYDQRSTLKYEALKGLQAIGDTAAVAAIGRLLDMSLREEGVEMRLAAIPVLGALPSGQAAHILVNALSFYDRVTVMREEGSNRGIYTGETLPDPYRVQSQIDSSGVARPRSGLGGLLPQQPQGFFGLDSPIPSSHGREDTIPREHELTHDALVQVGALALPVILKYAETRAKTPSLRTELYKIISEIKGQEVSATDSTASE
jgi:hypothetical protein